VNYIFPLYCYPNDGSERVPNLNPEIIGEFESRLSLTLFDGNKKENAYAPLDLLDYVYAVLHCPSYRQRYAEFLKSDFPHIPYPNDQETFWNLSKYGGKLRRVHLLIDSDVDEFMTAYPKGGDNRVARSINEGDYVLTDTETGIGQVWINDQQYFDGVPKTAWDFYIGGYQPARKWLKDRKGQALDYDGIKHYQRIVKALALTAALMTKIDQILEF
jgi:predicted helicase